MKQNYKKFIQILGEKRVKLDEPLACHTYIKIGGPADLFFTALSLEDLKTAIQASIKTNIPYFVLGGGSNILTSDKGIRGLVIKNRADNIIIKKIKGKVKNNQLSLEEAQVVAESGAITNLLVRRTIQEGLAGLEYFLGVPGTVGGAIYNNSHYKDQLIGNFIHRVSVLNREGSEKTYSKDEMLFAYDYSILHDTKETVLSATFRLKGGSSEQLWKKAESFAKRRSDSQPLNFPSSGCMFKNIKQGKYSGTSAGYLIDKAGLKGAKVGKAKVSEKHANFIINTGNATAKDIVELIDIVKAKVKSKFKVELEMEVFKVGEFN